MAEREVKLIKRNLRDESQVTVRDRTARGIDCALCSRDSLTVVGDVVTWLAPHGKEGHANAVTMLTLFGIYLQNPRRETLLEMKRKIEERLAA